MCQIILPQPTVIPSIFCMPPLSDYPLVNPDAWCAIKLVGHTTDPDGLYIFNGTNWEQWKT